MEYQVEVLREQHEDFTNFLSEKIRAYNNEQSLHHRESRQQGAVLPLQLIVTDQQQQWIGGITAEVYWGWVEIHKFWFSEEYRGKGMGKKLLAQAEWVAKDMGATKALLTTYEFQARTFYEAHGYQVVGEIKDYPPGSSYYTMVKVLA
ncbi:GNAT family N-acetyltransferase [Lysinibacillus boronitolerans]|uniref:GCN5 family acetyltransferase n=1 Tax=Lysinibacillus boronitolerans JCM 21713 = 10a = NBRC 103108 TaxID=1294264 RepID=A0ABR4XTM6_9BACI|nr:GNAT family N-acetyltransferase [Lysinibacillus boronitolerans]KGR80913.1 GCN5 family acetyltransferase [Lysinibacillus boronitolerans JCM 21713 = 10a = NBRC 103108]MCS1390911.1 GNAT family N-acetyltransferase [Lysinibacillus boronitolerans]